jgi:hypothetical protein
MELNEVVQGSCCLRFIEVRVGLFQPGVLESYQCGWAFVSIKRQQRGNKVLGRLGDGGPDFGVEIEGAFLDRSHNVGIRGAVKWWNSRKNNVGHYAQRPNVALFPVLVVEDFGCDVVGSSDGLGQFLSCLELLGCTEIDDLDLVKLFGGFQENVFRLEIPVNNMVLMAVGYAREQLLHQSCSIPLVKFALGNNFIEQLAALDMLSHDVETFLVLEVLENLHDVGVVERAQRVDLIQHSRLLLLVHVLLLEHFYGTLLLGLSVGAETHFTESAFA